ncbi:MAG: 50S ribosomal protein L18 [Acidobacteria bacterium]|nr:MAG: 50S ribosomal protein L18 [Acidobacteriota bacterium]
MKIKTKKDRRERIKLRLRKRIRGTAERPRLSIFRSTANMYVQAIDDAAGRTLASASTREPALRAAFTDGASGGNLKGAEAVGSAIAERLMATGIKTAGFDRNGFLYHGRVRAVAEAARKAGREF